ncbi:MAG: hypothetical protein V1702_04495 [Candidatus Woesearchaeota archaeon]
MKKAQAQTIMFILSVLTGALILIFGYRMLFSVSGNVDALKMQEFKSKLASDMDSASAQFGSYLNVVYNVPRQLSEVCFSAQSDTPSNMNCSSLQDYPLVKDSIDDNAGSNVFIIGKAPESLFIQSVDTGACNLKCFKAKNGKLNLILEGKGNSTLVS